MLAQLLPLLILQDASVAVTTVADRIAAPSAASAPTQTLSVRVSSSQGVLWQGTVRVAENQSASYSQNMSQASTVVCPPGSPYDRSERSSVSFNVYTQNYGQGRPNYRLDVSWAPPDNRCELRRVRHADRADQSVGDAGSGPDNHDRGRCRASCRAEPAALGGRPRVPETPPSKARFGLHLGLRHDLRPQLRPFLVDTGDHRAHGYANVDQHGFR